MGFRYAHDQFKALQESRARCAPLVEKVQALPWQRVERSELVEGAPVAVIATQDRYGIPLRAGLCLESGLVYLMDRLTPEGYTTFYKEYYRPLVAQFWQRPFDVQRFRQQGELLLQTREEFICDEPGVALVRAVLPKAVR